MTPDDILFAPMVPTWRQTCHEIISWITVNRNCNRGSLPLNRPRPPDAMLLEEFAEAYHLHGQKEFWRIHYPFTLVPARFEFDGILIPVDPAKGISYPGFGEVGCSFYRSIEDANLVPNTYSHTYILRNKAAAYVALTYLTFNFP